MHVTADYLDCDSLVVAKFKTTLSSRLIHSLNIIGDKQFSHSMQSITVKATAASIVFIGQSEQQTAMNDIIERILVFMNISNFK